MAKSTAKAEYKSMAHATSEILWIQSLLNELHIPFSKPCLYSDNQSAIALAHNPVLHSRTKHLELDIHFVREKVVANALEVTHVPATAQVADALTKPLSSSLFLNSRAKLNVVSLFSPP